MKGGFKDMEKTLFDLNKKGQFQLPSSVIWGVVGFMVAVIVGVLIVSTLATSNLFTSGSDADITVGNISSNLTSGINTVVGKFSTIFTVVAIVVILAILGVLILVVRKYGMSGTGGSFSQ